MWEAKVPQSIDYEAVGFKAGLEVHQQLDTRSKLFCRCPAGCYTRDHDGVILRHMRPTLSELGEYDGTALMEFKTKKNIIYLLNQANTCTYEMDDTPPFLINPQAVDVSIEQCLMLGCDIVDEMHIARKQYLDGSIPTGFQRTAIIGVNGKLPFRGRELGITQVSLEEDSCREVSDRGHLIVWRTDRLGMPLIETVTAPELKTPDEVEEAILLIGRVCRSTGHVRTGMGASRQDVNVSVRGGTRIEIKGVPKAGWAPALVHGEAIRQINLLKIRDRLQDLGLGEGAEIPLHHRDITKECLDLRISQLRRDRWEAWIRDEERRDGFELGRGAFCVRAIRLGGLREILSHPTQPERVFTDELRGRVRVISGLDQQPIILDDENWLPAAREELESIRGLMDCAEEDALLCVWGPEADTLSAVEEIRLRLEDATRGVPSETRQPFEDGSTDFERILPGPDRMYPDTDSPPLPIEGERVDRLCEALPEPPWVRQERYAALGVPESTIFYLIRRNGARLVDLVIAEAEADPRQACFFFGEKLKGLRRKGVKIDLIPDHQWILFFRQVVDRPVIFERWAEIVVRMSENPRERPKEYIRRLRLGRAPEDWKNRISETIDTRRPDHPSGEPTQLLRFWMGEIMQEFRGRVPAAEVQAFLLSRLEEGRLR